MQRLAAVGVGHRVDRKLGDDMQDFSSLVEQDPEVVLEFFAERLAASRDDATASRDCALVLLAFFEADDFDSIYDLVEEMPDDCPSGLIGAVLSVGADIPDFVDEVAAAIGGHPSIAVDELAAMMLLRNEPNGFDAHEYIRTRSGRASVAECHNATPDMLIELAGDDLFEIRYRVALNHSLPLPAQELLLGVPEKEAASSFDADLAELIWAALAVNPATEPSILSRLASVDSRMVRACLRKRDDLPSDALAILAGHDDTGYELPTTRLIWWNFD